MISFVLVILILIWFAGVLFRIYRQAHFYQIEEYQSSRYIRWLFEKRNRWLPARPVVVWFVGTSFSVMLAEAPGSIFPGVIGIIAAIVAVWPAKRGEVKKPFRRTQRVSRILGTAFVFTSILALLVGLVNFLLLNDQMPALRFGFAGAAGLLSFILAPLILILSNIVMQPVEAVSRRRFLNNARRVLHDVQPTVIGITGSYGKTSTKVYLAQILSGRYRTLPTPKSYNTLMGVSMVINDTLAYDYSIEYFIVEMGAYIPGEIAEICDLTHPHIAVIIDVGPQHLERFGSIEQTAIAKYELIQALPPNGVGVFNWDSPHVREMYERGYPQTRIAVSRQVSPDDVPEDGPRFIASDIQQTLDGLTFTVTDTATRETELFITTLLGEHTVTNILLATAVAIHEKMSLQEVARMVRLLQPAESRLVRQVTAQGITIINDAYSANPVGAANALRVLGLHRGGKRLLITPGIVELGDLMEAENRKLGEVAAQHVTDVILVGQEQTQPIQSGLVNAGFPKERIIVVDLLAESITWYQQHLKPGDAVLFLNDLPDTYHQ
ncbi:MAG: hypothetical protein D6737_05390 [Chloroflexi bacterium]|nr:MAG: hypothetical protein D6737_05390 [Chloroflexota bacterium]